MCFYYDDSPSISEHKTVKTRKPHKCEGCRRMIQKGQIVDVCSGLFDDAWFRYYVCENCQRTIYSLAAEEILAGCAWHEAWCSPSDLKEHLEERFEPVNLIEGSLVYCSQYVNQLHEERIRSKA